MLVSEKRSVWKRCAGLVCSVIITYVYHALVNTQSAPMTRISLNMIFYTHAEPIPTQTTRHFNLTFRHANCYSTIHSRVCWQLNELKQERGLIGLGWRSRVVFISDNGGAEILCVKFCQLLIGSRHVVGREVRVSVLTSDSGGTETLREVWPLLNGSKYVPDGEVHMFVLTSHNGGTETLCEIWPFAEYSRQRGLHVCPHIGQWRYWDTA